MPEEENRRENFYKKTDANPPHELVTKVLDLFPSGQGSAATPLHAIDLGCGAGSDTIEILKHGWNVLAIDAESAAIKYLRECFLSLNHRSFVHGFHGKDNF